MTSYASTAELRAYGYADAGASATEDAVLQACLDAVTAYIDGQTGRTFAVSTDTTRYYDVPEGRELWIDELATAPTTVTNGDSAVVASTEYNLTPRNTPPYYAIKLKESSAVMWECDSSGDTEGVIAITGKFGYSTTVPADIKEAVLIIAKSIMNRRTGESMSGTAQVTGAGVVITPSDVPPFARAVIARYRRIV